VTDGDEVTTAWRAAIAIGGSSLLAVQVPASLPPMPSRSFFVNDDKLANGMTALKRVIQGFTRYLTRAG